jgi:photosystem II stability/assembly factor-like uncharacterized protein
VRKVIALISLLFCVSSVLFAQQFDPKLYQEMRWRMIGPHRAGRTVPITGIPGQQNVFYMGVNNGGVWKSTDYGRTWQQIFEGHTQSVGALAVAWSRPDTIYVGSGEGLQRPDLSVGDGMYKSTDVGQSWKHIGLEDAQQISSVIVDPKDPRRVFVAALGHPYGANEQRGVFRSLDGGATWQKVLYKDENTGSTEVVFDPQDSRTVYAVLWSARRPPWTTGNGYDGPGSGLFKSTDGGDHWMQVTGGLPNWEQNHLGRIGFTIAPTDAKRMYALVDARKDGGLYSSRDGGEHWGLVNTEERIWGRGSDFAEVKVDPKDPEQIYVCNTSTYRSTDGGKNFTAFKGAPGGDDYHTIWINPENPQIFAVAADQGATISVNGGETWSSWYNQPTAQFYHVITDNRFPYWVYGGQQESGSIGIASRSDYGAITFRDWHVVGVEEYGYVAPDPLDPEIIYGGKANRFDQRTGQNQDISPVVIRTGKYRFNRTAPLIFSHVDPHTLYLGSNVLFKTTTGGKSWDVISPDLTRADPGVPTNLGQYAEYSDPQKGKHRGVIYSVGPSFKDVNTIWIGTDDGQIQLTRDGGKTWMNITPSELTPWSKVAQIEASHFDNTTAYAAVNRLRLNDMMPYVYRTHDDGKSWQKVTAGIGNEPVNTVREDPLRKGLLYAGTEKTVYVSWDDGDHWQPLTLNLPLTSIRDLVVKDNDLVVGTHGRSFWILDDVTALQQMSPEVVQANAHLFAPEVAYRMRRDQNTDTPLPPEEPAGQNPPDGAIVDYTLGAGASGPVTLEVLDSAGKLVRRYSSDDKPQPQNPNQINVPMYWVRAPRVLSAAPGMHRWVWDMRYPPPDTSEHEYPIAAIVHDTPKYPLGPLAVPGPYTVRLTAGGKILTQALTLKMDPRVKVAQQDLIQQLDTLAQLAGLMHEQYVALQQVKSVRAQIAKTKTGNAQLTQLDKQAEQLEAGAESLETLGARLATVYGAIEAPDAAPTAQQLAAVNDLKSAWQQLQSKVEQFRSAVKSVQGIDLDAPAPSEPEIGSADVD